MPRNNSRLRQFELQFADNRRQTRRHTTDYSQETARRQRPINMLGPQEDVVERRRHRHRMTGQATIPGNGSRNILIENVILLLFLAASIYGIYRLFIYAMNP